MQKSMQLRRGFTLIELLVVIAIIGILASVVLVNLNTARERARNAERVSTIDQLKLALQLFYDDDPAPQNYPAALTDLSPTYIPTDPVAPGGATLGYTYATVGAGATSYCLGVYLEGTSPLPGNDVACDPDGAGAFDAAEPRAYTVQP
jgi:prepilin-type N-terminal cleavage/methylation domain-containing protein